MSAKKPVTISTNIDIMNKIASSSKPAFLGKATECGEIAFFTRALHGFISEDDVFNTYGNDGLFCLRNLRKIVQNKLDKAEQNMQNKNWY